MFSLTYVEYYIVSRLVLAIRVTNEVLAKVNIEQCLHIRQMFLQTSMMFTAGIFTLLAI